MDSIPQEKAQSPRIPGDEQYEACYDERFERGYMREWPVWRRRRIGQFVHGLSLPPTGRALDFGCGQGVFTRVLQDTLPGWDVWGTDLSTVGLRQAARRVPRCRFAVGAEIADHGPFDFVFTHHVLEHVDDLDATLAFLASLLTPNGQMLHILPCGNPGSFEHGVCRLRVDGIDATNGRFFFDEDGHVRRLTTKTLSRAAEAQGFVLAHDAYSAQFWAAVDRISSQERETIAAMFDPSRAVDPAARRRLGSLRIGLALLRLLKRPPALLFRGAVRDVLGHADWSWRDRAVLTASNPVFLVAFPLRAALRHLATREWERHRSESNGSEMYLHFTRQASVPAHNASVARHSDDAETKFGPEARAAHKRWLENWKRVSPLLEAERWERLRAMTDAEAQNATRQLLELWQPDWPTDDGEELLLHQRVFARARRRV